MNCINCHNELTERSRFCKYCGATQLDILQQTETRNSTITLLIWFYSIEFIICLLVAYVDRFKTLNNIVLFDAISALNTLVFASIVFRDIKEILVWKNFSIMKLLQYMVIAVLFSIAVQLLIKGMNKNISDEEYYYAFIDTSYPKTIMLLVIAVQPAIFEELAFRGIIAGQLKKIANTKQTIFITAFAFAVIHLSFLSLIWLLPFAIFLGYVREKENTIWYGVFMHFSFNVVACLYEFLYFG